MADDFDADAAAADLKAGTAATSAALKDAVGDTTPRPLFRTLPSGEVVDLNGQLLRGPIAPLSAKP